MVAEYGWNQETVGDIFEALMGIVCMDDYCTARGREGHPRYTAESPQRILAVWLDEIVYAINKVSVLQQDSHLAPQEWIAKNQWVYQRGQRVGAAAAGAR